MPISELRKQLSATAIAAAGCDDIYIFYAGKCRLRLSDSDLLALSASPSDAERDEMAIPDGWQLVPKTPTVEMLLSHNFHSCRIVWASMLAAAPAPPAVAQETVGMNALEPMPPVTGPRLPLWSDRPDGTMEDEIHWANNNRAAVLWLADNSAAIRSALSTSRGGPASEVAEERERLRFEGDLDKWMKIVGAGITGYQPEAYALMDMACSELVTLRAENERLKSATVEMSAELFKIIGELPPLPSGAAHFQSQGLWGGVHIRMPEVDVAVTPGQEEARS